MSRSIIKCRKFDMNVKKPDKLQTAQNLTDIYT